MNKALIVPIVALFALLSKKLFGLELATVEMDIISDGILAIATLTGVFMEPNKK